MYGTVYTRRGIYGLGAEMLPIGAFVEGPQDPLTKPKNDPGPGKVVTPSRDVLVEPRTVDVLPRNTPTPAPAFSDEGDSSLLLPGLALASVAAVGLGVVAYRKGWI
jgi:hypothetical protein